MILLRWGTRLVGITLATLVGQWGPNGGPPPAPAKASIVAPELDRQASGRIRERFGLDHWDALLQSSIESERRRGYRGLGRLGTPQALERLVRALESSAPRRSLRERLALVRALAPHARHPAALAALARALGEPDATPRIGTAEGGAHSDSPLGSKDGSVAGEAARMLLRETAAMALAACGSRAATDLLSQNLSRSGPIARAAANALAAHPPDALGLLQPPFKRLTLEHLELLDTLSDIRLSEYLRNVVVEAEPHLQAIALRALYRLRDPEVAAVAAYWLESSPSVPAQRRVALEILARVHHPDWPEHAAVALTRPEERTLVLRLLAETPSPTVFDTLLKLSETLAPSSASDLAAAMAHSNAGRAVRVLRAWLRERTLAAAAAHTLSEMRSSQAQRALLDALDDPAAQRWAFRGAVARTLRFGEGAAPLTKRIVAMANAASDTDRSDAAWASAALNPRGIGKLLTSRDPAVIRGAARAMLLSEPGSLRPAARQLEKKGPVGRTEAFVPFLADPTVARELSRGALERWFDVGGIAAGLVSSELARRLAEERDPRLLVWLEHQQPWMRIQVARGLGRSDSAHALFLLEHAYERELDAQVREALIAAIGRHGRSPPFDTLTVAEQLDPSQRVRDAATLARRGKPPTCTQLFHESLWIPVEIGPARQLSSEREGSRPRGARGVGGESSNREARGSRSADVGVLGPCGQLLQLVVDEHGWGSLTGLPSDGYASTVRIPSGSAEERDPTGRLPSHETP